MTLKTLAASAALIGLGLIAASQWRLTSREAAALKSHPPTGQIVMADGLKVHLQIAGTGPDLVMIHGANGNLREFTFALMDQLSGRYRVIAVDRPGLGYSDPLPGNDASVTGQARVLRQAMAQIGVQNPIVLGQSYGGTVALAWALQEPPAALVLVSSPSLPWPGELDLWYRITASALGRATLVPLASALVAESYVRRAIDGDLAPRAHVTLLEKDTRLAVAAARSVGFEGPLGARAAGVFKAASEAGMADLDDAALLPFLRQAAPRP